MVVAAKPKRKTKRAQRPMRVRPVPRDYDPHRTTPAAAAWYAENREAVDFYNAWIAEHGLFSDAYRKF